MTHLLLTFDVEELDWGRPRQEVTDWDPCLASAEGLRALLPVLARLSVRAAFFCTARFARGHEALVQELHRSGHEVGSHGWDHRDDYRRLGQPEAVERLRSSRRLLEEVIGDAILGVRTPRLTPCPAAVLGAAGYLYDASVQPTWISTATSGRLRPRRPWRDGELVRVPLSTLPLLRLPLSWYVFRVLGPRITALLATAAGRGLPCIHLYFHPWEAADLGAWLRPHPLGRGCGPGWVQRFEQLVRLLVRLHPPSTPGELAVAFSDPGPRVPWCAAP